MQRTQPARGAAEHAWRKVRGVQKAETRDMPKRLGHQAGSPDDANPHGVRSAAPFVPKTTSVRTLRVAVQECRGCDLYKTATQAVFGAGGRSARALFVGEQP